MQIVLRTYEAVKPEKLPLIGAGVAAICCLAPLLVTAAAALGLSAFGGYLGALLLALLALAVAMFAVRISRARRERVRSGLRGVADPVATVDMG